ncbi:hypothetical protein COL922a_014558, partial [Colletotrichum nupharicola]
RLSVWPQDGADTSTANEAGSSPENEGPPEKKRKDDPEENKVTAAPEKKKTAAWSHIPILTSTPDGEYVVALTAEDKCIRVFQIEAEGTFLELSSRMSIG